MHHSKQAYNESRVFIDPQFDFIPFVKTFGAHKLYGFQCYKRNGDQGYYYSEVRKKKKIVLHHTAGHLRSDILQLTRNNYHVSVPYMIARNGTLIQLFDPDYWSFHLGRGAIGGNENQSSTSIGIELCNYGYLERINDQLHTIYSRPDNSDVYCHVKEYQLYKKLATPYRGEKYFARYTDMQYQTLSLLLLYLEDRYQISLKFLPLDKRFSTFAQIPDFSGVCAHVNFRSAGKWDISPLFDFEKLDDYITRSRHNIPDSYPDILYKPEELLTNTTRNVYRSPRAGSSENYQVIYGPDGPEI